MEAGFFWSDVITQDICNKFIEIQIYEGCIVWPWCCLLQHWTFVIKYWWQETSREKIYLCMKQECYYRNYFTALCSSLRICKRTSARSILFFTTIYLRQFSLKSEKYYYRLKCAFWRSICNLGFKNFATAISLFVFQLRDISYRKLLQVIRLVLWQFFHYIKYQIYLLTALWGEVWNAHRPLHTMTY